MNMPYVDFIELLKKDGFEEVYHTNIKSSYTPETEPQHHYIFAHRRDGILCSFDTYHHGNVVNGAKMYFNWKEKKKGDHWKIHCLSGSGVYIDRLNPNHKMLCWAGEISATDGFDSKLTELRHKGTFLKKWIKRPHLWLINYEDEHNKPKNDMKLGEYWDRLNSERIAAMPKWVQYMIEGWPSLRDS